MNNPRHIEISQGRVIDPASGSDAIESLFIADGRIAGRGQRPAGFVADKTIDASGLVVCPGLFDLSARGLGGRSELQAAVAGGITTACCPPDTTPPLDEPGLVATLRQRADESRLARVLPVGALTAGLGGSKLAELLALRAAGCIAFSQALARFADLGTVRQAMLYAATFDLPLWLQAEDPSLAADGVAHAGEVASRLGLAGIPVSAESSAIFTLLELAAETGVRLHLTRLSSARGVALVAEARARGVKVTCDVGVHAMHYCDEDIGYFNTHARLSPPLRAASDRAALRRAVADGTIQAICSDHTPVSEDGKALPFDEAKPGASGLELLLPLTLRWAAEDKVPLVTALSRISEGPANVAARRTALAPDATADLCIFDPAAEWTVQSFTLSSRGKNTPALGKTLRGQVRYTLVGGSLAFSRSAG
jgi:dihydroorotase